jgi:hypothetical protein
VCHVPAVSRTAGPLLALPVAGSSMGFDPASASSALKPAMQRRTISSADEIVLDRMGWDRIG